MHPLSVSEAEPLDLARLKARGLITPPFALPAMIDEAARRAPDKNWIETRDTRQSVTFGQARTLSLELAQGLMSRGYAAGDRIALCMPNHPAFALAMLAAWRAGGIISGLHPAYTDDHLLEQLAILDPWALVILDDPVTAPRLCDVAKRAGISRIIVASARGPMDDIKRPPCLDQAIPINNLPQTPGALPCYALDAPAVLQFTGGSSGSVKAATLTHANLSINLGQFASVLPKLAFGRETFLGLPPLSHILGLNLILNSAAYFGSTVVLEQRFDADETAQLCQDRAISFFGGVPTMLAAFNNSAIAKRVDWSKMSYAAVGGAPVLLPIKRAFEELAQCSVLQGYGLSETSPAAAFTRPDDETPEGCAGAPVPGTRMEIRDLASGETVLRGESGEIVIAGPQIMSGYWRNTAETESVLTAGVFRTGDIGRMDDHGRLYILDRLKDLIISNGVNIYPARVENAIARHPAVREVAVVGQLDPQRGEIVRSVVVLHAGQDLTLESLQSFLKGKLSPLEMPRVLDFCDNLPKSPAGKILRRAVA